MIGWMLIYHLMSCFFWISNAQRCLILIFKFHCLIHPKLLLVLHGLECLFLEFSDHLFEVLLAARVRTGSLQSRVLTHFSRVSSQYKRHSGRCSVLHLLTHLVLPVTRLKIYVLLYLLGHLVAAWVSSFVVVLTYRGLNLRLGLCVLRNLYYWRILYVKVIYVIAIDIFWNLSWLFCFKITFTLCLWLIFGNNDSIF